MTLAMVQAIVGLLLAFNAGTTTVANVEAILLEKVATTTQVSVPLATTTVQITPTGQVTPVLGSVTNNPQPTVESKAEIQISRVIPPTEERPHYTFWVRVLDDDGASVEQAPVRLEGRDGTVEKKTNQRESKKSPWEASMPYGLGFSLSQGVQIVTITSGELTKSVTIGE